VRRKNGGWADDHITSLVTQTSRMTSELSTELSRGLVYGGEKPFPMRTGGVFILLKHVEDHGFGNGFGGRRGV
jgi:hypothetical protein